MKANLLYGLKKIAKMYLLALAIGVVISLLVIYFTDFQASNVLKIIGGVIVFIGFASQLGSNNINRDYNYNMARMTNQNFANHENRAGLADGSVAFMLIMALVGLTLFVVGYYLV